MEIISYLNILNRRKWIVVIAALTTLVAYSLGQAIIPGSYETKTVLRVVPYSPGEPPYGQLIYANRIMNTFVELTTSGPYLNTLREELGLDKDRPDEIVAEIILDTELMQIIVKDRDPLLARDAANFLASMIIDLNPIRDIQITIVEPAETPEPSSNIQFALNGIMALIVGTIIGIMMAFLIESLDSRLYSIDKIAEVTGSSIIAKIPNARRKRNGKFLVEGFPYEDAFRRLGINILKIAQEKEGLKILMFTSAQPNEGKSTVTGNLAISLAQSGYRVLLMDADLRCPTLHTMFNLPSETGLSNLGQLTQIPSSLIQKTRFQNLDLIPSGPITSESVELLGDEAIAHLLAKLEPEYDFVLVDVPACQSVVDAAVLLPVVDGVILIARLGQVREHLLIDTCEQLSDADGKLCGLIINNAKMPLSGKYHKYYKKKQQVILKGFSRDNNETRVLTSYALATYQTLAQKKSPRVLLKILKEGLTSRDASGNRKKPPV